MISDIGARIRQLRQKKHMTQGDLCGEHISRNMLSMIENGKATPSLETLDFLAQQLNVSLSYLLADDGEAALFDQADHLEELTALYEKKNWQGAIDCAEMHTLSDDRVHLILSDCHMQLGVQAYQNGLFLAAKDALNRSLWYIRRTRYPTDSIQETVALYQYLLEQLLYGDESKKLSDLSDEKQREILYRLLPAAKEAGNTAPDFADVLTEKCHRDLIHALQRMHQGAWQEAKDLLLCVLPDPSVQKDTMLRLMIYRYLESCYCALRQFEQAHEYASQINALIAHMRGTLGAAHS